MWVPTSLNSVQKYLSGFSIIKKNEEERGKG